MQKIVQPPLWMAGRYRMSWRKCFQKYLLYLHFFTIFFIASCFFVPVLAKSKHCMFRVKDAIIKEKRYASKSPCFKILFQIKARFSYCNNWTIFYVENEKICCIEISPTDHIHLWKSLLLKNFGLLPKIFTLHKTSKQ